LGTNQLRLGREVLDFFKAVTALGTAIGIQRQSTWPFRMKYALCLLYRQGDHWSANARPSERGQFANIAPALNKCCGFPPFPSAAADGKDGARRVSIYGPDQEWTQCTASRTDAE
jgi:hypothetical protein